MMWLQLPTLVAKVKLHHLSNMLVKGENLKCRVWVFIYKAKLLDFWKKKKNLVDRTQNSQGLEQGSQLSVKFPIKLNYPWVEHTRHSLSLPTLVQIMWKIQHKYSFHQSDSCLIYPQATSFHNQLTRMPMDWQDEIPQHCLITPDHAGLQQDYKYRKQHLLGGLEVQ